MTTPKSSKDEYLVKDRLINRNIFDKQDPEQLRGIWLRAFSFSFNDSPKAKNQSELESVKEDLYKEIYKKLKKAQANCFSFCCLYCLF
ncbi:MAG: hypothetical protein QNJ42_23490 [Crocosphaera sp.]|nr:hypothetical protein [Crocosphaera sp.]